MPRDLDAAGAGIRGTGYRIVLVIAADLGRLAWR